MSHFSLCCKRHVIFPRFGQLRSALYSTELYKEVVNTKAQQMSKMFHCNIKKNDQNANKLFHVAWEN